MDRKIQFIFVQRNHKVINLMQIFSDFEKDRRVKIIDSYQEPNNAVLKKIQKIHYSQNENEKETQNKIYFILF